MKQIINLEEGATPSYVKPYRIPHAQVDEIQKQVNKMLDEDTIESKDSFSEWSSPILLVPKKIDATSYR